MSCLKIYLPFTHIISFSVAVIGAILALRYIYSAMGLGRGDSSGDNIMATSYLHYDRESRLVKHQEESPSEFPFAGPLLKMEDPPIPPVRRITRLALRESARSEQSPKSSVVFVYSLVIIM